MRIGYARVSTEDQNLDLQLDALRRSGCTHIFTDYGISGAGFDRPGLKAAIEALKAGDCLVVWRLDRLGRSLTRLIQLVDRLGHMNVQFHSLNENIDTSSSGGRLVFHIMGALAEFERALISERTKAGMQAARARGLHVGRLPSLSRSDVESARLSVDRGDPLPVVAAQFGVSDRTLRRYLNRAR